MNKVPTVGDTQFYRSINLKKMKNSIKIWMPEALIFCTSSLQAQITGYIQGDENYALPLAELIAEFKHYIN
jgi:hypothetical protein